MNYLTSLIVLLVSFSCNGNDGTYHADVSVIQALDLQHAEIATFAGGCFWCTEAVFERVKGVKDVVSGYTGGTQKNPTYKQVSYGKTDHAEGVQIFFDPDQISYGELVEIFFATHDPTTLNRQGPDIGRQYRSAVYYHNEQQKDIVKTHIKLLTMNGIYKDPIVTEVAPFGTFYPAEDYHQDFYANNPNNAYIQSIAVPKVNKFKKRFKDKLKATS
jgi:peptide-methionine (S)-S-oxide reductase